MPSLQSGKSGAHAHPLIAGTAALAPAFLDDWSLSRISKFLHGAPVRLQLWNGRRTFSETPPVATVLIKDRETLIRLLLRPSMAFGEAYASGRILVTGDLVQALEAVNRALAGQPAEAGPRRAVAGLVSARENVHAHYDLGNDFYRLWLDEAMFYTCAYFEGTAATLEEAQRAKADYVCRKLRLQPGERVIDAGCGWGGLALHMARHYGVTVRAYNISDAQLAYAREQAAREGLADRVTFVDGDYRSIDGHCDAFASIGMLEHVGPSHYAELGRVMDRTLDPARGRALLHFVGRNSPKALDPWIVRHIFPGAYPPALSEVLPGVSEAANLSVLDIENLRLHYALTLRHWLDRFEAQVEPIRAMFDDEFVRTWRLYLASSEASFTTGDMQLFQITCGRVADNRQPWTRHALYEAACHGSL